MRIRATSFCRIVPLAQIGVVGQGLRRDAVEASEGSRGRSMCVGWIVLIGPGTANASTAASGWEGSIAVAERIAGPMTRARPMNVFQGCTWKVLICVGEADGNGKRGFPIPSDWGCQDPELSSPLSRAPWVLRTLRHSVVQVHAESSEDRVGTRRAPCAAYPRFSCSTQRKTSAWYVFPRSLRMSRTCSEVGTKARPIS